MIIRDWTKVNPQRACWGRRAGCFFTWNHETRVGWIPSVSQLVKPRFGQRLTIDQPTEGKKPDSLDYRCHPKATSTVLLTFQELFCCHLGDGRLIIPPGMLRTAHGRPNRSARCTWWSIRLSVLDPRSEYRVSAGDAQVKIGNHNSNCSRTSITGTRSNRYDDCVVALTLRSQERKPKGIIVEMIIFLDYTCIQMTFTFRYMWPA